MNTRLSQDAADVWEAYQRAQRHKQGYGPRPVTPLTGRFQHFATPDQLRQHQDWIKQHEALLPF